MSLGGIAVHLLLFGSGFTALVYEVLWERSLRLAFGVSTYSVALVTASFMGGLAIGYAAGRSSSLARFHPLRAYGAAEAGIALYALVFPFLLDGVDAAYLASGGSLAVRAALAFVLLLPPAALMGITLPVVSRMLDPERGAGPVVGGLYAMNTAGAVVGSLAAGWFLLRVLGAAQTNLLATVTNFSIAAVAFTLSWALRRPQAPESAPVAGATTAAGPVAGAVVIAAFVAGFLTMGLQVVWNRTLVCVVENNTTSFSLILAAVLIGSALGGGLYSLTRGRRPLGAFVIAGLAASVYVVGSIGVLNRLYAVTGALQEAFTIQDVLTLCIVRLLAVLLPVAPVAAAGAFLLPALVDLLTGRERGRAISNVFAADSLGSVGGALTAGFLLIPAAGLTGSLTTFGGLALATVALVVLTAARGRALWAGLTAVAVSALALVWLVQPLTLTRWYDGHQGVEGELLMYEEGAFGTVSVFQVGETRDLLINCIEEVPNHRDALVLFKVLGHTPLLLHGSPSHVLVNALGGGITLGSVVRHDVQAEAVELVPEVRRALPLFAAENGNALEKQNWRLVHDDGRNYLRLADRRYEVITADATHPAAGESWPLYTREYYRIVKQHLTPDGIFAQWLPLHNLVPADFRASLATFREAFADVLVLFVGRYSVLLGATAPIEIDPDEITRRMSANPEVARDLAEFGIERGEDLLKYVVLDAEGVDRMVAGAEILTDDRATVEFAELHRIGVPETSPMNMALLESGLEPAALARRTGVDPAAFEARRRLFRAQLRIRERTPEATFTALMELEEAKVLAPRDADLDGPIDALRGTLARFLRREHEDLLGRPDLEGYLEVFDYARRAAPDDPFFAQLLGAALLRLERYAEAIPHLERAVSHREGDVTYLANLTFAYERAGRYSDALKTLDRIQQLEPGNPAYARVRERLEARLREEERTP